MTITLSFKNLRLKIKKYTAILPDGKKVHFGIINHQHYRDDTPLKLYSHLDIMTSSVDIYTMLDIMWIILSILPIILVRDICGKNNICLV